MIDFKQDYYESSEFWKPSTMGEGDKTRVEKTYNLLPKDIKNLLDVGCGNGIFCNYVQQTNTQIQITGVDRSSSALKHVKTNKLNGDITNIPFNDNEFDCVVSLQVLEHLPFDDHEKALSELVRVSKKYILISVPLDEKTHKNITTCPRCKTTFNVDLHLRSYNILDLQSLFSSFNYSCISIIKTGSGKKYIGLKSILFLKSQKKKEKKKFNSPICPVCGFKNVTFNIGESSIPKRQNKQGSFIRLLKTVVKAIWPKVKTKDYWVICLYQKNDNNNRP